MKGAELATVSGKPMILSARGGLRAWFHYRDRIGLIENVYISAEGLWEGRFEAAKGWPVIVEGTDCLLGDLGVPPDLRDMISRRAVEFWRDERGHWRVIAR